jgi:hypothetical protein
MKIQELSPSFAFFDDSKAPNRLHRSLDQEIRTALGTAEAAFHLGRSPQTLRLWACTQTGPIQPLRVNGRLMWPVNEIKKLLGDGK